MPRTRILARVTEYESQLELPFTRNLARLKACWAPKKIQDLGGSKCALFVRRACQRGCECECENRVIYALLKHLTVNKSMKSRVRSVSVAAKADNKFYANKSFNYINLTSQIWAETYLLFFSHKSKRNCFDLKAFYFFSGGTDCTKSRRCQREARQLKIISKRAYARIWKAAATLC